MLRSKFLRQLGTILMLSAALAITPSSIARGNMASLQFPGHAVGEPLPHLTSGDNAISSTDVDVLSEMLRLEGHDVTTALNGVRALEEVRRRIFDLVITDLIMPEKEGLETITDIRREQKDIPIIASITMASKAY